MKQSGDAAHDRSTERNHQSLSEIKWQITLSPSSPFLILFSPQQALFSVSSLFFFTHLNWAVCLFHCAFIRRPLFLFYILHLPKSTSLPVCHVSSSQRIWQPGRCRTDNDLLSPPEGGGQRPGPERALAWNARAGSLTATFGKLTGFTALGQRGQNTARTPQLKLRPRRESFFQAKKIPADKRVQGSVLAESQRENF